MDPYLVHQDCWVFGVGVQRQYQFQIEFLYLDFENIQHRDQDVSHELVLTQLWLEQIDTRQAEVQIGFDLPDDHLISLSDDLEGIGGLILLFFLQCLQDLISALKWRKHVMRKRLGHQLNSAVFCFQLQILAKLS